MFSLDNLPTKALEFVNTARSNFEGSDMVDAIGSKLGLSKSTPDGNMTSGAVGENGNNGAGSKDSTYSQTPEEVTNDKGSSSGIDSNILAYPANLGSDNLSHFVKLEVFIVKTENLNLVSGSGPAPNFDEFAIPRNAQNTGGTASDIQKNAVKYTKLQEMIGLPIPDSLMTDYSMMWSRAEGGMVSGVISVADALSDPAQRDKYSFLKHAALGAGSGISNLASQVGLDGVETNLKLLTKRASNPRNEFLFDGVNNRSFNLAWKFIPRDAKETEIIRNIGEKLKLYMHPELDESTAGKFYIFPAIFDITFMVGAQENEYLPRTSTCALTNLVVNYNGAGMPSFFDGTNAPFAIEMQAQFTELEFLHRKRFKTANNPDGVAR